jgi:hypothetical protein
MIRPVTLIAAFMFALSGAYLFAVKHRAQVLDDQLASVTQATRLDEQRIRVLQAQWALEADPSRLAQLSAEFTNLQPMKPNQLVTLASLGSALPAPGSAVPGQNPAGGVPAMPVAAPGAGDAPVAEATTGQVAEATHAQVAEAARNQLVGTAVSRPARMADVEAVLHNLPAAHHALHLRHNAMTHEYAEYRPQPPSMLASQVASAPLPPPRLIGAQIMSVRAVAPAPPVPPMPEDGGSMLGMAQNLPQNGSSN